MFVCDEVGGAAERFFVGCEGEYGVEYGLRGFGRNRHRVKVRGFKRRFSGEVAPTLGLLIYQISGFFLLSHRLRVHCAGNFAD